MLGWLLVPLAYLLGSVSCAILICRAMGLPDPRGEGSGNPGATNVMRIGGKKAAALTFIGDLLKGFLPVYFGHLLGLSTFTQTVIGLAAFLGHLYPIFFGFKGGKGVATCIGVLLGLNWWLALAFMATWLSVYKLKKISSLSALVASVLSPLFAWFITYDKAILTGTLIMTVILLVRHKSNIQRLLAGEEGKPVKSEER